MYDSMFDLQRARLGELMGKAVQRPLVTVVAGAGYGKTVMAASFADTLPVDEYVFFKAGEMDNLEDHFWSRFCAAFGTVLPKMAEQLKRQGFPCTLRQHKEVLDCIQEGLATRPRFILFVDNCHLIKEEKMQTFFRLLAGARVPGLVLVLISRRAISFSVAEDSYHTGVFAIGWQDLSFTEDEVQALYAQQNLFLSKRQMAECLPVSLGWPFLMGLALRQSVLEGAVVLPLDASFDRRPMEDLMEREYFDNYTAQVQKVLVAFSFLPFFKPELGAFLGKESAGEVRQAVSENMFCFDNAAGGAFVLFQAI